MCDATQSLSELPVLTTVETSTSPAGYPFRYLSSTARASKRRPGPAPKVCQLKLAGHPTVNRKMSLVNVLSGRSSHLTSVAAGGDGLTCGWDGDVAGAALTEALDEGDPDPVAFGGAPPASQAPATVTMNTIASVLVRGTFTTNAGMPGLVTLRGVTRPRCPSWRTAWCRGPAPPPRPRVLPAPTPAATRAAMEFRSSRKRTGEASRRAT
jgi:hypothetical protein